MRRLLAEFAGTFVLVFAGTGAIIVDERPDGGVGALGIAVVFGLAIGASVFTTRHISGAHFNPAVSCGLSLIGRFRAGDVPGYVIFQLGGAVTASLLLKALLGTGEGLGTTAADVSLWRALVVEIVLTAILVFVIARVATTPDLSPVAAAAAIGGAVALGSLVGGPLTGGSMNPARSFGPALVAWSFGDHWLYWLGPLIGGALGASLYALLDAGDDSRPPR